MDYANLRNNLVQALRELGVTNELVLAAFSRIPRELFVADHLKREAYENVALSIDAGQTISQPYTVARMMELLDPQPEDVVLEIGTGSGYQAALLASVVKSVYTIERIPELAQKAQAVFNQLEIDTIVSVVGDGTKGLPQFEPYDGLLVTAGAASIHEAYFDQLADGGRLVMPVGNERVQAMVRVVRHEDAFIKTDHGDFMFVPLIATP